MINAEKAEQIDKALKFLAGAASGYRHGRGTTATNKFDKALDILQRIEHEMINQ
ncbi:hypothetical protein LCGC14_1393870 [marine sediment metagenome]|uniref:Uncharacterized protein n=1 Tax=marine sediment metagenome TaxID=412755 RepID=A0A0F9MEM2_9ZZZZ